MLDLRTPVCHLGGQQIPAVTGGPRDVLQCFGHRGRDCNAVVLGGQGSAVLASHKSPIHVSVSTLSTEARE